MNKLFTNSFLSLIFIFTISGNIFPQHHQHDDRKTPVLVSDRTEELLDKIKERLDDLDAEYLTQLRSRDYNRAKRELHKIYGLIEAIENQQVVVEVNPPVVAMADQDYRQLVNSISNESFEDNKVAVLQSSAKYNYFSVQQIIGLMDLSSFSSWKLKALELTYPFVVDKNNSFKIINALTFSEDKQKAQEILDKN